MTHFRPAFLLCSALLTAPLTSAAQPAPVTPTAPGAPLTGGAARSVPVYRPQVVARFPHDPDAFTEGLELVGGVLYEGNGLDDASDVRRVNLQTGQVIASRKPPVDGVFGEGVTVLGGQLFELTWQSGLAFVYDAQTLRETGRFRYTGEGWGLTNNGQQLIMSDGSSTITYRDPRTFAAVRTLKVTADGMPVERLNELECAGGFLWANVWLTNRIARIDPKTGKVTAWLDLSELAREAAVTAERSGRTLGFNDVPNGVAFDRARGTLLLTGKRWPVLFEVRVPGLVSGQAADARAVPAKGVKTAARP